MTLNDHHGKRMLARSGMAGPTGFELEPFVRGVSAAAAARRNPERGSAKDLYADDSHRKKDGRGERI